MKSFKRAMSKNIIIFIVLGLILFVSFVVYVLINTHLLKEKEEIIRDEARIRDLKMFKPSLELYFKENGRFIIETSGGRCIENWDEFATLLRPYLEIEEIPKDPFWPDQCYWYISSSDGSKFKILAKMETESDIAQKDWGEFPDFFEVFSNTPGSANLEYNPLWLGGDIPSKSLFSKREKVFIENSSAMDLVNVQVKINVFWKEGMNDDFSNLIFTDDKQNPLPFYVFDSDVALKQSAMFWIKHNLSSDDRNNYIYIYYGNKDFNMKSYEKYSFDDVFTQSMLDLPKGVPGEILEDKTLIGEWLFNEGESFKVGATASRGAGEGALVKSEGIEGQFQDSAISFDGQSNYLEISSRPELNLENINEVSFSFWMLPTKLKKESALIWKKYLQDRRWKGWGIGLRDQKLLFTLATKDKGVFELFSNSNISPLKWYFIVATFNKKTGEATIFINGKKDISQKIQGELTSNDLPLRIAYGKSGDYFAGIIDEIRMHKRILSPEEVRNYKNGRIPFKEKDLVFLHHFDEGSGEIAMDDGPSQKYHAELIGFTNTNFYAADEGKDIFGWTRQGAPVWQEADFTAPLGQTLGTFQKNSSALAFVSPNSQVFFEKPSFSPEKNSFTLEVSIFPIYYPNSNNVIFEKDGQKKGEKFSLGITNKGSVYFVSDDGYKNKIEIYSSSSLKPEQWYHIALVGQGSTRENLGYLRMYINSNLVAQKILEEGFSFSRSNYGGKDLSFGADVSGENNFYGIIDNIRFFERVLLEDEIRDHYNFLLPICDSEGKCFRPEGAVRTEI